LGSSYGLDEFTDHIHEGNSKRAAELSLLFERKLLDAPHENKIRSNQQSRPLCHHFRPTEPLAADKRVKEATAALNDSSFDGVELSEDTCLASVILKLRIEFASEESDIELQAQEDFDLAKSRQGWSPH
jgi:hypothetical protein